PNTVMEEPVDGWTGARDVRSKGAEPAEPLGERRVCEVVRRQGREVARAAHLGEARTQLGAPGFPHLGAVTFVEALVHRGRRGLARSAREDDYDPVVLRQVERREGRAVSFTELRPAREEER